MSIKDQVISELIDKANIIFINIKFFIFGFTLISSLGYTVIYFFMYGYYFSGNEIVNSTFTMVSNLLPFDLKTMSIISIFFICIFYIISASITLWKGKKRWSITATFALMIILNILLTGFFAIDITVRSIFSFFIIWFCIGSLVLMLYLFIRAYEENIFILIKSFVLIVVLSIFLLGVLLSLDLFDSEMVKVIIPVIIPIFWLVVITLIKFQNSKLVSFLSYYLCFLLLYSIIMYLISLKIMIEPKFIIKLSVIPLIVNMILFNLIYNMESRIDKEFREIISCSIFNKYSEKEKSHSGILIKMIDIFFNIFRANTNSIIKLLLGIFLLFTFVFMPRVSMVTGQLIRIINSPYENLVEITYVDSNGNENRTYGNYYIEHNSVLYLSNCDWKLETIKQINYHIKPIEKIMTCQNK